MRVVVSVKGRFHGFDLAAQLERHDHLHRLITTYPKYAARRFGIPKAKVRSLLSQEVAARALARLPGGWHQDPRVQVRLHEAFERSAAKLLAPGADLFVGWSSLSLEAIRKARSMGMVTILERGSSHMLHQTRIIEEEFRMFGTTPRLPHPDLVEKELTEYEEADFIAIPSAFVRQTFLANGVPSAKLIQVPYGVSLDDFRPSPDRPSNFRVMHCGGIGIRKGCHYLLQAFTELDLPDAELAFVGRVAPELLDWAEQHNSKTVVFHGPKPQSELHRLYGQASVLCLASIEEGLAMVLAQAMACGIPVVATENTGAADIVRDGQDGFIVPARDVEAIKDKLRWLHDHPEARAKMGDSARRHVQDRFSWTQYGTRITDAYKAALEAGPQDL